MLQLHMIEIIVYETEDGKRPFQKWLEGIDRQARSRVQTALLRLEEGNTGSLKSIGAGVHEIRITFGPGYRVYLGQEGNQLVILLHGGTKKRQSDDIARAKDFWRAYQAEKTKGDQ